MKKLEDSKETELKISLLQDALKEQEEILKKISNNNSRKDEINLFIEEIKKDQDFEFKLFSPRDFNDKDQEIIEEKKDEIIEIDNDNQYQYTCLEKVSSVILKYRSLMDFEKNIEKTEKSSKTDIRNINTSIIEIQEKERQRIARDIHDTSLQNLTHVIHQVELASIYIENDPLKAKLELAAISKEIKKIIAEMRNTIFELRPMTFDDLGFQEAIEKLCDTLKEKTLIDIETKIENIETQDVNLLLSLYRIVQEGINNAIKHSKAKKINVELNCDSGEVKILINDDGCGFNLNDLEKDKSNHYGIYLLKERVSLLRGKIKITTAINKGTKIFIRIPL